MSIENFCDKFEKNEITQEHIEGMKVVVKTLDKRCKSINLLLKEKEQNFHNHFFEYGYDYNDIQEMKNHLSVCVEMKILAEKTMRKYQHIKNERNDKKEKKAMNNYVKVFNAKGIEIDETCFKELGIEIKMPKLVIMVTKNNDEKNFVVEDVYDNRTCEEWTVDRMKERGLLDGFLDKDDLKESLNWNLNGDSDKYRIKIKERTKEKTIYTCFIYD